MGDVIDTITLTGLRAVGYHGVLPEERRVGQTFVVDVELSLPLETRTDDLADTVSYAEVAQAVHDIVTGEPCNLIETLAGRIADECLARQQVESVRVTIHKPHAPVAVEVDDLAVTIQRSLR